MKKPTIQTWRTIINSLCPGRKSYPERKIYAAIARAALKKLHPFDAYLLQQHHVKKVPYEDLLANRYGSSDQIKAQVDIARENFSKIIYTLQRRKHWVPQEAVPKNKPVKAPVKAAVTQRDAARDRLLDATTPMSFDECLSLYKWRQGMPPEELATTRRELLKVYHPDKVFYLGADASMRATHQSQRINQAYDLLRNGAQGVRTSAART